MKRILMVLLLATALPVVAAEEPKAPPEWKGQAWMCSGTYALCIKALCGPETNGYANCQCFIKSGWNMGPNTCADRSASLTSTYSNAFNDGSRTIGCPSSTQKWAWCYGSPCKQDPNDPSVAVCNCPVRQQPSVVLIDQNMCPIPNSICAQIWSAATPEASMFANNYYYWWMTSHGLTSEQPAKPCPTTTSTN